MTDLHNIWTGMTQADAMKEWGACYYAGFTYFPRPAHRRSFKAGPYQTAAEARAATHRFLEVTGYTSPRWWQYWRWSEHKPPELGEF